MQSRTGVNLTLTLRTESMAHSLGRGIVWLQKHAPSFSIDFPESQSSGNLRQLADCGAACRLLDSHLLVLWSRE